MNKARNMANLMKSRIWIIHCRTANRLEEASKVQFCLVETIQVYLMVWGVCVWGGGEIRTRNIAKGVKRVMRKGMVEGGG
jgi:hypothetical protein